MTAVASSARKAAAAVMAVAVYASAPGGKRGQNARGIENPRGIEVTTLEAEADPMEGE